MSGASGLLNLARFTFQSIDATGHYAGAMTGKANGCRDSSSNGNWFDFVAMAVGMSNGAVSSYS